MPVTVYHGSSCEMKPDLIKFPGPRSDCDFGPGFYLTQERHIAEEWVCRDENPVVNVYELSMQPGEVLHLAGTDWLRVIIGFRTGKFAVNFKSKIIQGLIADDRLFDSLRDFTRGIIGDTRLIKCLDYCKLGSQYCLRLQSDGIYFAGSYILTESEKELARQRILSRRKDMAGSLIAIYRTPSPNERFVEDYLSQGDFNEV